MVCSPMDPAFMRRWGRDGLGYEGYECRSLLDSGNGSIGKQIGILRDFMGFYITIVWDFMGFYGIL